MKEGEHRGHKVQGSKIDRRPWTQPFTSSTESAIKFITRLAVIRVKELGLRQERKGQTWRRLINHHVFLCHNKRTHVCVTCY